ncbi:MAG: efflux RND transporter permease subunit [Fibrobacteria bacterium]|nr:efflux RND transporter permease subunit [Fibrobacteria bacterium]
MLEKLIRASISKRILIIAALIAITGYGVYQYQNLPTDAFPDVSPVMVPVFAEAHGMAPEEVERLITFPIESAMNGLPGVNRIKSTSAFGMAVIYIYFKDNVNIYFARQIVSERLTGAMADLPDMHEPPKLGPISTGLGEVFMYYLTLNEHTNTEGKEPDTYLRELNDWVVKLQLQTVPGVTEILSMGGHVLQYQIKPNPYALNKYKINMHEIVEAIQANNRNAGGQFLVLGAEEYLVRGLGLMEKLDDIRNIQIKVVNGTPVRLSNIADVDYGNEIRRGVVSLNGEKEVVAGIVMKLYGENTSDVIARLKEKIPKVQASLPKGVQLVPYYDQSTLVENATGTVKKALLQGAVLVLLVLLVFMGNWRSAVIVVLSLPLCALIAVIFMGLSGLSANLMSLGGIAIAIGMLGDGSIVMVENISRLLSDPKHQQSSRFDIIIQAAMEVGRPIIFSIAIIIIVFLPLFSLEGVEGKMFSPMAFTISFALIGSLLIALFIAPALSSFFLKKTGKRKDFFLIARCKKIYGPLLILAVRWKKSVLAIALACFLGTLLLIPRLGTEFIPILEEGAIQIIIVMPPSTSLIKATSTMMKLEKKAMEYPEVKQVISKIGRPEAGSHPHPVNFASMQLSLKPIDQWTRFQTKQELINALNTEFSEYPGLSLSFTQPIQNLFDELLSGVRTQLAIKLFGEDLQILRSKADEIKEAIESIPGLVDLSSEQSFGQPQIQIIADRASCARYGVNVSSILEVVELAIGGEVVDQLFLNTRRFGIHIRYQEEYRKNPEVLKDLLVHSQEGYQVPLSQVAEIKRVVGPIQVNREKSQRRWAVSANVRGRDIGSVVSDIQKRIAEKITIPSGYYIEYGGQFENQQRAMNRLSIIVPVAFLLIFFMLYLSLGNLRNSLLIFLNVPLALIGGILGLFLTGEYLSVPASVGFIALFGIAVQNGLVLVTSINQLRQSGMDTDSAVIMGGMLRLRPVLMTALTTVLGLVPLLLSNGMGSEVQRPLAVVVVFGLVSSTFLTLFLIPALYAWFAVPLTSSNQSSVASYQ